MKILSYFFFLATVLLSCQQGSPSARPKTVQRVRLNLSHEPGTLDPRKGGDLVSSHMHFMLFEGLTRLSEDGTIIPAQAETIELSSDGTVYTFHLRDAKWSNGDPVTAEDFELSWKDILSPTFPSVNAHLLYPIKNAEAAKRGLVPLSAIGVRAIDSKTLVVTLEQPTPYFLDLTAFCVLFPVNKRIDEINPNWAYEAGEHFVCNGPYRLSVWKHNNEILAEKNPKYWEKDKVRAESIHLSMVDNAMTALQMFENKELDVVGNPLSPLPVDALSLLNQTDRLKKKPIAGTTVLSFNTQKFPFSNQNIRKAFGLAINREDIVHNITQLDEQVALNAIPPVLKNHRYRAFFKDNDVETARQLLEVGLSELGVTKEDLQEITYYYSAGDLHGRIAQAIQQQIANALGILIRLEVLETKVFLDKLTKRDYQLANTLWIAQYSDQMSILERFKHKGNAKNYCDWENMEFVHLLERSVFETGDTRLATLEKAEEIFLSEMPIAPIYHAAFSYMVQPELADMGLSPIGDIYFQNLSKR